MRQVPLFSQFAVLGGGRMARHTAHYLKLLNLPFITWNRTQDLRALTNCLTNSSHILILVADSAIDEVALKAKSLLNETEVGEKTWVHFSGCLTTPHAIGAHPLSSFSDALFNQERYSQIPFMIETPHKLADLLPGLPNPEYGIDPKLKPLYHSLCVLSGNFTTILWGKLFGELKDSFGIPPQASLPYLRAIFDNLETNALQDRKIPLTGPLARGDTATINANLTALANDPFEGVYQAFVKLFNKGAT
ncbi:DUF2520 domain-containing protein [Bdellovibrionota bacterium FG-2]